jgi:hypothetical protein
MLDRLLHRYVWYRPVGIRLWAAWQVLLGRPVIYGVHVVQHGTGIYRSDRSGVRFYNNYFVRPEWKAQDLDPDRRVDIAIGDCQISIGNNLRVPDMTHDEVDFFISRATLVG